MKKHRSNPAVRGPGRTRLLVLLALLLTVAGLTCWRVGSRIWSTRFSEAIESRRLDHAEAMLADQRWRFLETDDVLLKRARLSRLRGDVDSADALLSLAATQGISKALIDRESSLLAVQCGRATPSGETLAALLLHDPEDAAAVFEVFVIAHSSNGDFDAASAILDLWMTAEPLSALLEFHRGEVRLALGHPEGAAEAFRRSLNLNDRLIGARHGLVLALIELKDSSAALVEARRVVAEQPRNVVMRVAKADLLRGADGVQVNGAQDDSAEQEMTSDYQAALEIEPKNYDAIVGFAAHLILRERYDDAFELLQRIQPVLPKDASLNYMLAQAAQGQGRTDLANRLLEVHVDAKVELDDLRRLERSKPLEDLTVEECRELALGYLQYKWKRAGPYLMQAMQGDFDDDEMQKATRSLRRIANGK